MEDTDPILGGDDDAAVCEMDPEPQRGHAGERQQKQRIRQQTGAGTERDGPAPYEHTDKTRGERDNMPTAKQYEIMFLLKAQMDGAFGGSFKNATQQIKSMENQINQYKRSMKDIEAYRTHMQKLGQLCQKFKEEERQLTLVRNQIKQNGTATREQANEEARHEQRLKQLSKAIENEKDQINKAQEALEKKNISINRLIDAEKKLNQETERVSQEEERLKQMTDSIGGVNNALQGMQAMAMITADAVQKVDSAIMTCIEGAGQLEYTMDGVKAVSGATEEETQRLTQTAKDLGATTIYTAGEVAQSLQTMGLAGADAEEMISGIPAVVNLAASAGEDLNSMTSIVMDGMNAFGLSGKDAVNEFADTLAKTATSSNTTVSVLGESLSYVEGTAANLGYNIQDVSLALAVMANNSLKGSVSGSALNTTLTRMSGANQVAAAEMDALGLSMYNADGTAKDLGTFLNELRAAFQGFGSDAQAAQNAAFNLAGQRGMRGLLSIVNTSDEEWKKMTEDIYNFQGAAEEMSNTRLDNYAGQVKLLESAWDALKTSIGEQFLPVGRSAAELLTEIIDTVNGVVKVSGPIIPMLAAGAQGFLIVGGVVSAAAVAVGALNMALGTFGVTMGAFLGPLAAVAAGIGGAAAIMTGIAYATDDANAELAAFRRESEEVAGQAEQTVQAHEEMMNSIAESNEKTEGYISTLEKMIDKDGEATVSKEEIQKVIDKLNEDMPGLGLKFDSVSGKINKTTEEIRKFNEEITQSEVEQATDSLAKLQGDFDNLQTQIKEAKQKKEESGGAYYDANTGTYFRSRTTMAVEEELANLEKKKDDVQAKMDEAQAIIDQYVQEHADAMGITVDTYEQYGAAMEEFQTTFTEASDAAYEKLSQLYGINKEAQEIDKTSLEEMKQSVQDQIDQLANYRENMQKLQDSGIDFGSLWDELSDGSAESQAKVEELAGKNKGEIQSYVDLVKDLDEEMQQTSDVAGYGTEKVQEQLDTVLTQIAQSDEEAKKQALKIGKDIVNGIGIGLQDDGKVSESGKKISKDIIKKMKNAASEEKSKKIGQDVDKGLINGMNDKKQEVTDKAGEVAKSGRKEVKNKLSKSTFKTYGKNAMQGVIDGVKEMEEQVANAFSHAGQVANQAYAAEQQINSPSRKFRWFSEMDFVGATEGAKENTYLIENAMRDAGQKTSEAYMEGQSKISISSAGSIAVFDPRMIAAMQTVSSRTPAATAVRAIDGKSITTTNNSSGITVTYAPNISVSGNADASSIRTLLRDDTGELRQMVRDAVYEIEDSERRWTY